MVIIRRAVAALALAAVALAVGAENSGAIGSQAATVGVPLVVYEVRLEGRDGTWLEVAGLDGRDRRRLTPPVARGERRHDGHPTWSPDGTKIAFVRSFAGRLSGLYVVNADATQLRRVFAGRTSSPVWSPSGDRVAFEASGTRCCCSSGELNTVAPDGSALSRLWRVRTRESTALAPQAWSPDGSTLLYKAEHNDGDCYSGHWLGSELWTVRYDGSARRMSGKSPPEFNLGGAVWSPDGSWIGYGDGCETICDLFVVRPRGGAPVRLTRFRTRSQPEREYNSSPDYLSFAWAGTQLVYGRGRSVIALDVTSRGTKRITTLPCKRRCETSVYAASSDGGVVWVSHSLSFRSWLVSLDGSRVVSYPGPRPVAAGTEVGSYWVHLP